MWGLIEIILHTQEERSFQNSVSVPRLWDLIEIIHRDCQFEDFVSVPRLWGLIEIILHTHEGSPPEDFVTVSRFRKLIETSVIALPLPILLAYFFTLQ